MAFGMSLAVLCFLIAVTSIQLIHVCEGGREGGGRSEREITEKSYMHILKMLWLSIELHSNKCLYSLQTYQQASLHWLACLRGLPTSAASNQLRPLVGGPAMVMKPFPDLSKHNLRGGCTRTHTHSHKSSGISHQHAQ